MQVDSINETEIYCKEDPINLDPQKHGATSQQQRKCDKNFFFFISQQIKSLTPSE